jgi:acetylornithine deacetylase/succinyl-diaminopimelate desuccinylase-like protein
MSVINDLVDSKMSNLISDLKLIRQPSVSARKQGLTECAKLVADIMNKVGINSEVLYLDDDSKIKDDQKNIVAIDTPPVVYGAVQSKANPNGKTILFYNHYDLTYSTIGNYIIMIKTLSKH